jgi:hypothetical protein
VSVRLCNSNAGPEGPILHFHIPKISAKMRPRPWPQALSAACRQHSAWPTNRRPNALPTKTAAAPSDESSPTHAPCCCLAVLAVNLPGTFYDIQAGNTIAAVMCPRDSYCAGLKKQRQCVPCPTGYTTNGAIGQVAPTACHKSHAHSLFA